MTRPDLKQMFEQLTAARGFTKESGFRIRSFEDGFVALEVEPKEELVQFMGYVHAGVVTGLADHAAGAAYASFLPEGRTCLTIELKINFMKPAEGDMLVAEARVLSGGNSIGVVQSNVYGEKAGARTLVATAIVTLKAVSLDR
ncbi:MAG: PaaI family thioesterase [Parvularculaceae bacterium]